MRTVDAVSEEVRKVSRSHRSLIAFLTASILLVALLVSWGGVGGAPARADDATVDATPLVLVGQKPRMQEFFAGNSATFTVGVTNTGTVALQTVVTNATTPSCNRTNLGPLAAGQNVSYTCTAANVLASFLNEIQATGKAEGGAADTHVANAFVNVLNPDLRITKSPARQAVRPGANAFFTIVIFNSSPDVVMANVTVDDSSDACDFAPIVPVNIAPLDSIDYPCRQTNVQSPTTSIVTVRAVDPTTGDVYQAMNAAWVETVNLAAELTPQPNTVPEPGGTVTFHVNLVNTGSVALTLTGLTTNQYGNVLDAGNGSLDPAHNTCLPQVALPTIQPYGGAYTCSFQAQVTGQPSDFSVILTATARDQSGQTATATKSATVRITNVPAAIKLSATADPPFIHPPSQTVTFRVRVDNTGEVDAVTVTQLRDQFLGSLDGVGTCDIPVTIDPGFSYQCSFSAVVSGQIGDQRARTITATARDDDLIPNTITANTTVTVNVTNLPTQKAFIPNAIDSVVGSSCADAFSLSLNKLYSFLPPAHNAQSVFRFTLPRSGVVSVQLNNFAPIDGQLVVWSGQCGALVMIGRNPDNALNRTVDLGTRPAGQYIIQIVNGGPTNMTDAYRLRITFD